MGRFLRGGRPYRRPVRGRWLSRPFRKNLGGRKYLGKQFSERGYHQSKRYGNDRSRSRSRSRSFTRSRSRSRSNTLSSISSQSITEARSRSRSWSRSKYRSRSRSPTNHNSKHRSRSRSPHGRSRSRSTSRYVPNSRQKTPPFTSHHTGISSSKKKNTKNERNLKMSALKSKEVVEDKLIPKPQMKKIQKKKVAKAVYSQPSDNLYSNETKWIKIPENNQKQKAGLYEAQIPGIFDTDEVYSEENSWMRSNKNENVDKSSSLSQHNFQIPGLDIRAVSIEDEEEFLYGGSSTVPKEQTYPKTTINKVKTEKKIGNFNAMHKNINKEVTNFGQAHLEASACEIKANLASFEKDFQKSKSNVVDILKKEPKVRHSAGGSRSNLYWDKINAAKKEGQYNMNMLQVGLKSLERQKMEFFTKSSLVKYNGENPIPKNEILQDEIMKTIFNLTNYMNALDRGILPNGTNIAHHKNIQSKFVDPNTHWCKICKVEANSLSEYLNHLKLDSHKAKMNMKMAPWSEPSVSEKICLDFKRISFKGSEFLHPASGFYCDLCKKFIGEKYDASAHMKSFSHNNQYNIYLHKDIFHENRWKIEKVLSETASITQKGVELKEVKTKNLKVKDKKLKTTDVFDCIKTLKPQVKVAETKIVKNTTIEKNKDEDDKNQDNKGIKFVIQKSKKIETPGGKN